MKKIKIQDMKHVAPVAYAFMQENDMTAIEPKRYDLENGIYINVQSYETQNKADRKYEAHREYVDIQVIISGEENISVSPLEELQVCQPYIPADDAELYESNETGEDIFMVEGDALILYPEDGHMPCVNPAPDKPCQVKKAIVKVPLDQMADYH